MNIENLTAVQPFPCQTDEVKDAYKFQKCGGKNLVLSKSVFSFIQWVVYCNTAIKYVQEMDFWDLFISTSQWQPTENMIEWVQHVGIIM